MGNWLPNPVNPSVYFQKYLPVFFSETACLLNSRFPFILFFLSALITSYPQFLQQVCKAMYKSVSRASTSPNFYY